MKKVALLVIVLGISGCSTYDMALMDQKSGTTGRGFAKWNGADATVEVAGKTYTGNFRYSADRTISVPSISQADNLPPAMEEKKKNLRFIGGNGTLFARAADNSGLRCVFALNPRNEVGSGVCMDDTGVVYDLQVN
ncbi:hypothetical protein D3C71_1193520 [compost metagenome]